MMKITCKTEEQFFEAVYNCVLKGLTFEADHDTLTINLLGGY